MRPLSLSAAALLAALTLPGRLAPADTISSTDSFLPAVHINGASGIFRTDVTIFNPDSLLAAVVDLYYTEADRDGTASTPAFPGISDREPR
jgi:hypothetical protein